MENVSRGDTELEKIDRHLDAMSSLVSIRVRAIAGGVALCAWSIMIAAPSKIPLHIDKESLLIPIGLALLCLLVDLFQYGIGFLEVHYRRSRVLKGLPPGGWPGLYRASAGSFTLKVILVLTSAVWLVVVVGQSLLVH